MARKSVVIRLAGESGEGVISSGDILTQAAARGGYWTQTFRTYPAEIKGGPCMYQVRMGDEKIYSHGKHVDLLVCFNQEAWDLHWDSLGPEGVILFDDTAVEIPADYLPRARPVRMEKLAKEIGGSLRAKNMVAVGAVSGVISFDTTPIEELVLRRYAHKQGVADANIAALRAGHDEGADLIGSLAIVDPVEVEEDRVLMSGNQAIALGAVAAGVKYFAGYPITPASDILEWLSAKLPQVGGITIQCEDEIASLASVLGASYTGVKAMTATSGPGLSLMTEMLGYAGTAEIPCVIIDAQRGGPSTGLPTKTEQSDLQHALYGGHGEAPRVVVAPVSVEDCFWTTIDAFNYSERYQVPVILLTDQGLATRMEVIHKPDLGKVELWERKTSAGLRRRLQALRDHRGRGLADGHPRRGGRPVRGHRHRARRARATRPTRPRTTSRCRPSAGPSWTRSRTASPATRRSATSGPTSRSSASARPTAPSREAVEAARAQGLSVGAFYPRVLGPFPADAVNAFVGAGEPRDRARGQLHRPARPPRARRVRHPRREPRQVRRPPLHGRGHPGRHHRKDRELSTDTAKRKPSDYKSDLKPIWCPGCGDFGVLASLYRAFAELDLDPARTVVVSGIGCSSRLPGFVTTYGFHSLHGRPLPVAMGVKLANPDLTVIAVGGDGDGFAIGAGHFPHAARRNVDITYLVMDNEIYGLTKGQVSPTSLTEQKAPSTPWGNLETPLNTLAFAVASGASFVARGASFNTKALTELIVQAMEHTRLLVHRRPLAVRDVQQPPGGVEGARHRRRARPRRDLEDGRLRPRPARRLQAGDPLPRAAADAREQVPGAGRGLEGQRRGDHARGLQRPQGRGDRQADDVGGRQARAGSRRRVRVGAYPPARAHGGTGLSGNGPKAPGGQPRRPPSAAGCRRARRPDASCAGDGPLTHLSAIDPIRGRTPRRRRPRRGSAGTRPRAGRSGRRP